MYKPASRQPSIVQGPAVMLGPRIMLNSALSKQQSSMPRLGFQLSEIRVYTGIHFIGTLLVPNLPDLSI